MSHSSDNRFLNSQKEYLFACRKLNYYPWEHEALEHQKQRAWELVRNTSLPMATRVRGARTLIRCYFDRSMRAAMLDGFWADHPKNVKEFGRMVNWDGAFPDDVLARLYELDGVHMPGHIKGLSTYWVPLYVVVGEEYEGD
jgi:hypothetical protein